ncbi:MAG: DNA topoisomerase 3 [Oscillospiraceae bacterium]|nr:DNA topoisomerase 3 [Oscillospiraceae bacterium]
MKLVIAEKPSVGNSIAKVIGANKRRGDGFTEGNGYIVSWCFGHLVALSSPEEYDKRYCKPWKFENLPILPEEFRWTVAESTAPQFEILKALMLRDDVDELICATDAGREGECVFRYVYYQAGCTKPFKRLWISSMTDEAIRDGFRDLRDGSEYDALYRSGLARNKADWIVGMNATQLFTVKYRNMLSVGRVQTPTLAMLVEREKKIEQFASAKYYSVVLNCGKFTAESDKIEGQTEAEKAVSACGAEAEVKNVVKEQKNANPPKLYDLTTLQRDANKLYGYTAQQTLDCAQKLYENKLMTYPRTDSNYITEDMEAQAAEMVKLCARVFPFGESYDSLSCEADVKRLINNDKVSDHHALLPTKEISRYNFDTLTEECYNVLCLVAARLLCAVAPKHTYDTVTAEMQCGDTLFTAKGKTVVQGGWKQLEADIKASMKGIVADASDEDEEDAAGTLPPLEVGKTVKVKGTKLAEHKTTPPKRYTEDMLLSAMEHAGNDDYDENEDVEKKGLGTPATRAAIIETLVKRQYVERKGKQLIPTDKGRRVIDVVPDNVKSAKMTAEWETTLQRIARGQASDEEFLSEIIEFTKKLVSDNKTDTARDNNPFRFSRLPVIGKCPKCGKNVYEFQKSYSCEDSRGACGFFFMKEMWGKEISETQAKRILDKGSSITLKGFTTKRGDTVSGKLVLGEDMRVKVEIEK